MIEWLSSKVAVAIAVVVVMASVLGYFAMQRDTFSEAEVADVAFSTARMIETYSSAAGRVVQTISVGEGGSLMELPAAIDGHPLSVNITKNDVIVKCGEYTVIESYSAPIHLWNPEENLTFNSSTVALLDLQNSWTGEVSSPGVLTLDRKDIRVSGDVMRMTFCYPGSA